MNNERIHLSLAHMSGQEAKYIDLAFSENWITSVGPNVDGFENDIKKYLESDSFPVALNSGTSALHLGLILLDIKKGDTVICQSLTFVASANPILYQGATPIFIDSEPETWNMCPKALEEAVLDLIQKGKKPKAIVTVHLYGMPCKIDEINAVALKYGIPVLEDSAEALGSKYKNQKCGTFGALSVISFNGNKIITTSGGGALVAKSKEIKDKAVFLSTQARDTAPHYQHSEVGYNYRMSNICAGIGRGQMEVLDAHVALRREMHAFYAHYFEKIEGVTILTEPNDAYFSNHWLSAVTVDPSKTGGKTREGLRLALEAANIESRPLWKPMHLQPVFENSPYYGGAVAEGLFENGLCLPSGSNLSTADRDRISGVLDAFFSSRA
ncbi:DegT/DnrJ/EryC1/StrS family aminotransferase [Flavobacterium macacae]|uniref:Aminotransferase class I/II-fold pyridoxal phosphate-dependent enzyme n=1 Tax=Flavobacterium macacae TaxID=2488993 RepID=A0A3P3W0C0_9FLAO|nr:DegT/DnrJ/EryC1/StrS family aminotransferase [Flavobacterium macacae]RRJ88502.1 aminotransferase class I/II-fold pyridoxal phosphate-dependent enzyme [Flavobacterium macacae]